MRLFFTTNSAVFVGGSRKYYLLKGILGYPSYASFFFSLNAKLNSYEYQF